MRLVRERRHPHALRLSLPQPIPTPDVRHHTHVGTTSPDIESLADLEKLAALGHGNGSIVDVRHMLRGEGGDAGSNGFTGVQKLRAGCLERNWRKGGTVVELLGHPFIMNRRCGGGSD